MLDLTLKLADEHLEKSKEEKLLLIDAEIERFSKFMESLGDWKAAGPLNNPERALIKTYLVQKLSGKLDLHGVG